jgi:hypothetical protein
VNSDNIIVGKKLRETTIKVSRFAVTGLLDYLSWGGLYTLLSFGLGPLLGLLLSAKSFFAGSKAQVI